MLHVHRRHDYVEFFHNLKRIPEHAAGCLQSDRHERVGRRLHVLHLRIASRVRVRQLRGQKAAAAQCCLSTRRESSDTGNYINIVVFGARGGLYNYTAYILVHGV